MHQGTKSTPQPEKIWVQQTGGAGDREERCASRGEPSEAEAMSPLDRSLLMGDLNLA